MTNSEKAEKLLKTGGASCVLVSDTAVYTSEKQGISPMMDYIEQNINLKGFSAADKIIGKAAAMLFALAGVKEVYAEVMSRRAIPVLREHGIFYSYSVLTDEIINRTGDGMCPMEQTVLNITDPETAYKMLEEKIKQLRGEAK